LLKWKRGETGFPLVDAAARELRTTGWVQQNVRMVAASFLTEYCNLSWVHGAMWYEDNLVDADLAINSMMWQNAGRSGTDQWNFLISPVQASTQDPSGEYVRRWVPELQRLPAKFIHRPWEAPTHLLQQHGIVLGRDYPERCFTDLIAAREEAKQATISMRQAIAGTWMNDRDGYDVIELPGGKTTKLFTKREYRITKAGSLMTPAADPNGAGRQAKGTQKGSKSGSKGAGGRSGKGPAGTNLKTSTVSSYRNYWQAWAAGGSMPKSEASIADHPAGTSGPKHELSGCAELSVDGGNSRVSRRWGCRLVSVDVIDIG